MRSGVRPLRTMMALAAVVLGGCTSGAARAVRPSAIAAPHESTRFIVYGDMRFTEPSEREASRPAARQALVARIAFERPDAVFLTGDIPWNGGHRDDYAVYGQETGSWRSAQLHVHPVLGNHEFKQCDERVCLENWWNAFPELRGRRWYALSMGSELRFLALDSNASLLPGSEQGQWLKDQIADLPAEVRFLVVLLHHPLMTDGKQGVRANETALAEQLKRAAASIRARIVVCAAHVHNYERFERDGMVLLVSGGGGAKPVRIVRSSADLYQKDPFPNFHYIRFELTSRGLSGEMVRLADADAPHPETWEVSDTFRVE